MAEFFRAGVGVVLWERASDRVIVFERVRLPGAWQYPQGGIEPGEQRIDAALREMHEEAGLLPAHVRLVAEHPDWLTYELPVQLRSAKSGRGQTQRWYLFELVADPAVAIALDHDTNPEFRAWRRTTAHTAASETVDFRRSVYNKLADWLEQTVTRG